MKKKILVIGSLNMDMVTRMEQMPLLGETVLGNELQQIPGGKGANQACAAGGLGGDVTMLGCVGKDESGEALLRELEKRHVKTQYMKTSDNNKTGTAIIYLNSHGNNSIVVIQGANLECDTAYLKQMDECFQTCDYILLQMEIPTESIYYAVTRGKELGKTVLLNPAPAPDSIPAEIIKKIDYLTPNETELMKLSGMPGMDMDAVQKAAQKLISGGVKNVIVTLGDKGCLLVNADACIAFPARKVQAVDTTAAGDCFNGAFLTALAEGKCVREAIIFANTASSIVVTKKGAISSIPDREEVETKLNSGMIF